MKPKPRPAAPPPRAKGGDSAAQGRVAAAAGIGAPTTAAPPVGAPSGGSPGGSHAAKTAATPAARNGEEAEPPAEEEAAEVLGKRTLLLTVPSWLVSFVVHLVLILVLALMTVALEPESVKHLFVEGGQAEPPPELEELVVEAPLEMHEHQAVSEIAVADMGMANLGSLAELGNLPSNLAVNSFDDGKLKDIGELMGTEGQGFSTAGFGDGGAEFFGVKASGRHFFFLVDSSRSMNNGKWEAAKMELLSSLSRLKPTQYFYLVLFDGGTRRMFDTKNPEERAIPATPENVRRVEYWLASIELELGTAPYDSVVFAMERLPDAIYILTDGRFTDKGKTEKYLQQRNHVEDPILGKQVKVPVHAICFGQEEETLKKLAEGNGGTFRFVPNPKKK